MDTVDELARKLISAFEVLAEEIALEQLAVPEDLGDPDGTVDLWVASSVTHKVEEPLVVRAEVSVPTAIVLERDAEGLSQLFREELLHSDEFRQATTVAGVASHVVGESGVPLPETAEQN